MTLTARTPSSAASGIYAVLAGLGLALAITLKGRSAVRLHGARRDARLTERARWKAREARAAGS